jgi:hypothetical protein
MQKVFCVQLDFSRTGFCIAKWAYTENISVLYSSLTHIVDILLWLRTNKIEYPINKL